MYLFNSERHALSFRGDVSPVGALYGQFSNRFTTGVFHPPAGGSKVPLAPHLPTTSRQTSPRNTHTRPGRGPGGRGPGGGAQGAGPRAAPPIQYQEAATARGREDPQALRGTAPRAHSRLPARPCRGACGAGWAAASLCQVRGPRGGGAGLYPGHRPVGAPRASRAPRPDVRLGTGGRARTPAAVDPG